MTRTGLKPSYNLVGLLMGLPWYGALLLPRPTRSYLMKGEFWYLGLSAVVGILAMCLTSWAVCATCRRWIARAQGWKNLLIGAALPFYGALLFALIILPLWIAQEGMGRVEARTLVLFPLFAFMAALASFYIVVPMGIVSQYVMRWAANL